MNMAGKGYGIDHMALAATELVPRYRPETVIIEFMADDLNRSRYNFPFGVRKPYLEWHNSHLALRGVPVASPEETLAEHAGVRAQVTDARVAFAAHSRVVCLFAQVIPQRRYRRCLSDLTADILRNVCVELGTKATVVIVYLAGALPEEFEATSERTCDVCVDAFTDFDI